MSGEDPPPDSQRTIFWLCLHMAEGVRELSVVSFIKALMPFMS